MVTKQKESIHDNEVEQLGELENATLSSSHPTKQKSKPAKKLLKTLYLRIPENFWEDIQTISSLTGLSMNAVCMDLLRPAIKSKLKLLQEE